MKRYGKYRDSGIEWLDTIPAHWKQTRIKYTAQDEGSLFLDGDWIESKVITDSGIRYITTGNVKAGYYSEQGHGYISEDTFKQLECTEVFAGDLIISRLNNPIGRACIVPDLGSRIVTSVDNVIHRPDKNFSKGYLLHLFSCKEYFEHTGLIARGATMQRISRGLLGNVKIPAPPTEEQTQIAKYLNYKTQQIDDLIAKKEQLIKLLEEERTALINELVTGKKVWDGKGFSKPTKTKDSGIDWLGEIPEDWEVLSFRHCIQDLTDYTANGSFAALASNVQYLENGFSRLVRLTDLRVDFKNEGVYVSESAHAFLRKSELKGGELLMANVGAYAGVVKLMPNVDGKHTLGPNMFLLRVNQNTTFFYQQLNAPFCAEQLKMMAISSAQPKLNKDNVRQLKVVKPEIEHQIIIAEHLAKEDRRIQQIISNSNEQINLLKEFRTKLISEVVTGKVDVRDEVIPDKK